MKKHLQTVRAWLKKNTGEKCKFSDGRIYQLEGNGEMRRISPVRPWKGKDGRRLVIKLRRINRVLGLTAKPNVATA